MSDYAKVYQLERQFFQELKNLRDFYFSRKDTTSAAYALSQLVDLYEQSDSAQVKDKIAKVSRSILTEISDIIKPGFDNGKIQKSEIRLLEEAFVAYRFALGKGEELSVNLRTESPSLFLNNLIRMAGFTVPTQRWVNVNMPNINGVFESPMHTLVSGQLEKIRSGRDHPDAVAFLNDILLSPTTAAVIDSEVSQGFLGTPNVLAATRMHHFPGSGPVLLADYFFTENNSVYVASIGSQLLEIYKNNSNANANVILRHYNLSSRLEAYIEQNQPVFSKFADLNKEMSHAPVFNVDQFTQLPDEPLQPLQEPEFPTYSGSLTV